MRSNPNLNRHTTSALGHQAPLNNFARRGTGPDFNQDNQREHSLYQGSFTDHDQMAQGAASPFRPFHPSVQPNQSHLHPSQQQSQQQAGLPMRERFHTPAKSISGLQMGQQGTTPLQNYRKGTAPNIYRDAGTMSKKRGLNDVDSQYYSAVDQSALLNRSPMNQQQAFTPRVGKGNQRTPNIIGPQGQDDQSTSKPRYSQTVVRNPTLQASLLNQSKARPNEITGKLDKNLTHMNASFQTPLATKYQSNIYQGGEGDCIDGELTGNSQDGGHALSSAEFREAFKAVSSKLGEQFLLSDDIRLSDIDRQTQSVPFGTQQTTPQAVYDPMTFIPTQHIRVPAAVDEAQQRHAYGNGQQRIVEISKRNKVVYFAFGNKLIVWDYAQQSQHARTRGATRNNAYHRQGQNQKSGMALIGTHAFQQQITCIKELTSTNVTAGWQKVQGGVQGCLQVLVATATEIKLVLVKKEDNQHALSVQESAVQPLNQGVPPSIIVEFQKTGRLFCDGTDGNITEIKFENSNETILGKLMYGDRRKLKKEDHQRENFLSKLIPSFVKTGLLMRYTKEVVELKIDEQRNVMYCLGIQQGSYANGANGQSVIEVFSLGRLGNECTQLCSIYLWKIAAKLYEQLGELDDYTDKYARAREFQIQHIEPVTYSQSQIHHLQLVTQNGSRIFLRFQEAEAGRFFEVDVESMGLQSDLVMMDMLTGSWEISGYVPDFPNVDILFNDQTISRDVCRSLFKIHPIPFTRYHAQSSVENVYVDASQSLMVYQTSDDQQRNGDSDLKVCFLKRNECVYNHYKEEYVEGHGRLAQAHIPENFSVAMIHDGPGSHAFPGQGGIQLADQRRHAKQRPETLLKVQTCRSQVDIDVLVSLGLHQVAEQPAWGKRNQIRPYYPSSEVEKQVYLQGTKLNLLTDSRLIEVSTVRPIDNLVMILMQIARSSRHEREIYAAEFEDFAESYTMREACAMLVQILADSSASYFISKRVQELLNVKKQQPAMGRRPVEMNRSSMRGGTTSLTRNRVGQQTSQANTRIGVHPGRPSQYQQSFSLGRGAAFDHEALVEQEELMHAGDFVSLLTDFHPDDEMQCASQVPSQEVLKTAYELLVTYGDTINNHQLEDLRDVKAEDFEHLNASLSDIDVNKLYMYSNKHKALYMYLYRVLQPIWDLNITSQPRLNRPNDQICNVDLLLPIGQKLRGIYEFLSRSQRDLQGRVCQNPDRISESSPLYERVTQLCRLKQTEQDFIEVAEKQSCRELRLFIRRCLDVIEFLGLINSGNSFRTIMKELSPDMLKQLAGFRFKEIVNSESNPLIRKMLEITVRVTEPGDPNKTSELLRQRTAKAQNLCRTLFSPGENRIFIGESLLQKSLLETDINNRESLMKEALASFEADPRRVDLETIIPMLVGTANFQMIGYLCLRKLDCMDITKDVNKIEEMYDIIVTLFSMLDRVITDFEQSRKDYNDRKISKEDEGQYSYLFMEHLLKVRDTNKHLTLRGKLVQMISEQKESRLIAHLFNFFLLKGKTLDFLVKDLDKDVFKKMSDSFINQQTKSECLTKDQFGILRRLLEKSRLIEELASLVIKIITDQIVLKRRAHDSDEWIDDQLSCMERHDLVRRTKQLLGDVQENKAYGVAEKNQNKSVVGIGQTGALIEGHINLQNELHQCLDTLEEQLGAIESAESKVAGLRRQIQVKEGEKEDCRAEQEQLAELQEFRQLLDQRLIGIRELTNHYIRFNLSDRKALTLLYKPKPSDLQGHEQLKQRQKDALKNLAEDICKTERGTDAFREAIQKQISTLFGRGLGLKQHDLPTQPQMKSTKELLFYFVDCVAMKHGVDVSQVNGSRSWWLAELLFRNMKIMPSEFIREIVHLNLQARKPAPDTTTTHIMLLACFREWTEILQNDVAVEQAVRMDALTDLKTHGHDIWSRVLVEKTGTWLEEERLKLEPSQCREIEELHKRTRTDFQLLLQQHVQHAHIVQPRVERQDPREDQAHRRSNEQQRPQMMQRMAQSQQIDLVNSQEQRQKGKVSREFQERRSFQATGAIVHSSQRSINSVQKEKQVQR